MRVPFDPRDLRRMRIEAGYSLPELGSVVGHDHSYLSRIERDRTRCPAPLAVLWAEACGYRLRWVRADESEEERLLGHLGTVDRAIVGRLAEVLPRLEPAHRATLISLIDLWERAALQSEVLLAADE